MHYDSSVIDLHPPYYDKLCNQVHDDPVSSPVDGPTQWPLRHFEELLQELIDIAKVTKGKQQFNIDLSPYDPDIQ